MLLWWLCVSVEAKKPAPAPSDDGAAGAWYREFRPNVARSMGPLRDEVRRLLVVSDAAAAETRREALLAEAQVARELLAALPPYEADESLSEVADRWFGTLVAVADELPQLWVLYTEPPIDDADVSAASFQYLSITRRLDAADAAWEEAELAFASRNGVRLGGREIADPPEAFVPPQDIVPAGCPLPPEVVARLATAYRDQLERLVQRLVEAWEQADPQAAIATLNEIKNVGAWQKDQSLRNAALTVGVSVLAALSAGRGIDERVAAAISAYQASQYEFEVQWALSAYQQWAKQAGKR